jgi:acyl transferase domain-containing protein
MSSEAFNPVEPNDIAIVGMALRVPGAHGVDAFWSNLRAGTESVQTFSDEELLARGVSPKLLRDPAYVKRGPWLEGFDRFDAEFFGFSPKEAAILDPQHRQFLECAWEALEDAAHPPDTFGGAIGVFGGCGMSSYFMFNLLSNPALVESVGLFLLRHTGNDKDFLTTRVSYCFDLTGPSINVQTACSTSLVAVHVACQSLLGGECDMALAGGVTVEVPQGAGYLYKEGEILAPDGHCRVFDRESGGTLFGSGVGIVVLRRLEDAVRDGDRIYAVIKGSAVNSDGGRKVGYLAPSVDGQAAAVAEALACAGVDGETIEFIEAHGSGTPIGDPIEVAALTQALGRAAAARPASCGLGSVKANIGHLDTASGVASLIKTALALHHGEIPPMPNFAAANPAIAFDSTPFYVVDRLRPWPRGARPRRAGVNSLGVGGTNAHVVLEESPLPAPTSPPQRERQLLCLSAKSARALEDASKRLAKHLRDHPEQPLADVAFTLLQGRRAFEYRSVLACRTGDEAATLLESNDPRRVFTHTAVSSSPSVVFLLPGGGAQHARMGCDLYATEPVFREHVDRGIEEFRRRSNVDLRSVWIAPDDAERAAREFERPSIQLPAIFILEYALAQLWMSVGVRPDALIGHSLGENTAACLAGVLSFEDALGMVALRGELFERLPAGGMISVALAADELARFLGPELDLAAANAPSVSVVSGPRGALDDLARRLVESNVDLSRIPITTAAHSRVVESILPAFLEYVRGIQLSPPQIPFVSNLTGTWITAEQATSPQYWVDHLRGTVRFADGLRTLLKEAGRVFLEVGPGKVLSSFVRQQPDVSSARAVLATLRHAEEPITDTEHVLTTFGRLWACGVAVDRTFPVRGERRSRVSLPTYPFQHKRYWIDAGKPAQQTAAENGPPKPRRVELLRDGFYVPVWKERGLSPTSDKPAAGPWLVFLDSAGVGDALVQRLRARGDTVVTVRESDDNCKLGPTEYVLAPERGREGYTEIVRDLVATGMTPQRIVHLWLLTRDESYRPGSNFFHRNQERGFYSLFFLAQALDEDGVKGPLHVTVVGNGMLALDGEPLLHPAKATVTGPCKVIPREFPGMTCSVLDVPLAVSKAPLNGRSNRASRLEPLVDAVEAEVLAAPRSSIGLVRAGRRYEQAFEHTTLKPADRNGHAPVREGGVYLVTGGVGGLGLAVAAHLAGQARVRIILVGRTSLPDRGAWEHWLARHGYDDATSRRIRAIQAIEDTGAEIVVACADVTDIEAMRRVIDETRRRFGKLNGVIHAAGVLRDAPILTKTQQQVEDVFAPKVHGTLVLDALLGDVDLDFMILFSSVSALVAPPGQVDYVAASAFMDAYARSVDGKRKTRTVSVNWGVWRDVGMAVDALSPGAIAGTATNGRAPHHPLFESRHSDPDGPLVLESRISTRTHWILDEHRTRSGCAVMPGTAYIEMVHAALAEAGEPSAFEIQDLLLLEPLQVADGESRHIAVELRPDPLGYVFQVQSRAGADDASTWTTHAQARVSLHSLSKARQVSLAEIEARCTLLRRADRSTALTAKQDSVFRFGPRWRTLRDVYTGESEVLARLELDDRFAGDLEQFGLHPALLDIAVSAGLEGTSDESDELWVPVSYKSIRVHAPLPKRLCSWVKGRATNRGDAGVLLFDVVVCDESGRVCVELDEFAMRKLPADFGPQARPVHASTNGRAVHTTAARPRASSPGRLALEHNVEHGIQLAEGMEALQRILGSPSSPQLVATSLDLDDLHKQMAGLGEMPSEERTESAESGASREPVTVSGDGIERTLVGFWRELLGVTNVSVRDNFFDLGGHSLIAVRLFARIKKTYHVDFPISLLFEAPTIERCAEVIRRAIGSGDHSTAGQPARQSSRYVHLVPMHPGQGGDKTPFFLVAGMFGNVLNLRHLAHLLGNERRFYGLQARGLHGADKPHETFEEMAADYLAEVRRVQPSGPYLLGGFSGGGITALEMARQLEAVGEEVALLAMLDSSPPRSPTLTTQDRVRINWERMRRRGPAYVADWARDKLRWQLTQMHKRRQAAHEVAMSSDFRSEEVGAAFRRALARYDVQHHRGRVNLFRPKLEVAHVLGPDRMINSKREFVFHENGWGPFVDGVDVHEVPGTHDSMVLEPNVRVLAIKLRECIQAAESRMHVSETPSNHDVVHQ